MCLGDLACCGKEPTYLYINCMFALDFLFCSLLSYLLATICGNSLAYELFLALYQFDLQCPMVFTFSAM
jgi:hypothetical protein